MKPRCLLSVVFVLLGGPPLVAAGAQTQFAELARHVPDSANAIMLVNVQKLLSRPLAQQEGWREDAEKRIAGGLASIPVDANQLLLAAQLDLRSMRPVWQLAMIRMDAAPALETLARQHGGVADTVGDVSGLRLPDDSYLVRFSDQTLGGFAPGDRQAVSRWIRGPAGPLPAPLQEAIGYADAGAEIIMALDLSDVAAIEDVQQGIQALDALQLKDAKLNLKELAQLLVGVKSLMLGMTFEQRPFGKLKLEFDRDVNVPAVLVKPLLLDILADRGLMLDEFEQWKAEVQGRRVMFGGYLTSSGLTRLSSLVDLPTGALHDLRKLPQTVAARAGALAGGPAAPPGKQPPEQPDQPPPVPPKPENSKPADPPKPEAGPGKDVPPAPDAPGPTPPPPAMDAAVVQAVIPATRQYFLSTRRLVSDLRGRKREARTFGQVGCWYEMYARRIDRLPLLNVDEQMLGYGGYVANQLRNASLAIKGSRISNRVRQVDAVNQGIQYDYHETVATPIDRYGPGGWRPGWQFTFRDTTLTRGLTLREEARVRTQVRTHANAEAAGSVQQIEHQLDAAAAEIRVAMAKKYQTDF